MNRSKRNSRRFKSHRGRNPRKCDIGENLQIGNFATELHIEKVRKRLKFIEEIFLKPTAIPIIIIISGQRTQ